jgi:hypothetical protein
MDKRIPVYLPVETADIGDKGEHYATLNITEAGNIKDKVLRITWEVVDRSEAPWASGERNGPVRDSDPINSWDRSILSVLQFKISMSYRQVYLRVAKEYKDVEWERKWIPISLKKLERLKLVEKVVTYRRLR